MNDKAKSTNLIEEIAKVENELVANAFKDYGICYENCIKTYEKLRTISASNDKAFVFAVFWSQLLTFSALYILSLIRKHTVQSNLLLRNIYEILCYACYALHETNPDKFADTSDGFLKPNKKVKDDIFSWMNKEFSEHSNFIKERKSQLNDLFIHANFYSAMTHVKHFPDEQKIRSLCFDDEDYLYVTDMLLLDFTNEMLYFAKVIIDADQKHRIVNFPDYIEDEIEAIQKETSKLIHELYAKSKPHIDEVMKPENY